MFAIWFSRGLVLSIRSRPCWAWAWIYEGGLLGVECCGVILEWEV